MTKQIQALKLARQALTGDGWKLTGDAIRAIDVALAEQPAQQEPVTDHSCKDSYELIMKWADIYAAQTGRLYSEAAQDPSKVARMADERTMLACAVAQALSQPAKEKASQFADCEAPGWSISDHARGVDCTTEQPAQQQEPVAWMFQHDETGRTMCVDVQQVEWGFEKGNPRLKKIAPLYTSPPASKPWVGLTGEEIHALMNEFFYKGMQPSGAHFANFARAIEAKLREKNT